MPCNMEGQVLIEFHRCLNDMKIIIGFLIGDFRKRKMIFLQDFHRWLEDGGEELGAGFQATTVYVKQFPLMFCHRLKIKCHNIAKCQASIG